MTDKHWEIDEEDLEILDKVFGAASNSDVYSQKKIAAYILRIYTNLHDLNKRLKTFEEREK